MNIKFNLINILHLYYFIQLIFSNSKYEIKNFILLNITIMETFSFGIVFQNEYIFVKQHEISLSLEFIAFISLNVIVLITIFRLIVTLMNWNLSIFQFR